MEKVVKCLLDLLQAKTPEYDFKKLHKEVDTECDSSQEPVVLFLGTVSMKPTMYRSASAIMLFIKGHGLLMDCAEGSYGQLLDHFQSIEKVNDVLLKMRAVFITHIHGDHQLGIIKIMLERDKLIDAQGASRDPNNKLYVVAPTIMMDYMETMRTTVLRQPDMVVLVPSNDLNPEPELYYQTDEDLLRAKGKTVTESIFKKKCPSRDYDEMQSMISKHQPNTKEAKDFIKMLNETMNVSKILAIETDHCTESYGCLVISANERGVEDGFGRIFYSGDTNPCQNVINYCHKVTLLIHEATFEDSLAEDARWKKHTTIGQAIEIGQKCQAWRTVLTHFSPRYQKIAEISDRNFETKTMVAFDHMRVKLSQFEWAYHMLDIYKQLFTNDDVVGSATQGQSKPQKGGLQLGGPSQRLKK